MNKHTNKTIQKQNKTAYAIAGEGIHMYYNSTTHQFRLIYKINTKCTLPTEIFANQGKQELKIQSKQIIKQQISTKTKNKHSSSLSKWIENKSNSKRNCKIFSTFRKSSLCLSSSKYQRSNIDYH